MSEPEKIKDVPKPPPEQPKETTPQQKTIPSAFDKILEQQKMIQQSPLAQGKISEQGSSEHRIKEITKWQDQGEERRGKQDKDESSSKEKAKDKQKAESQTVTKEGIICGGDKKGSGGFSGGGGHDKGGFGSETGRKFLVDKKISDVRGLISNIGQGSFAGRLASAMAGALKLSPQDLQFIVNKIVEAIHKGKNSLGEDELRLILKGDVFAGLRLRFTSKHGKVAIEFETANADVKKLFKAQSGKIQTALEKKGIAVETIKVV